MSNNVIPRPEYPRPQMVRDKWMNLNGEWEFEIDHSKSGKERKLFDAKKLNGKIMVPFCPESKLSGVEFKDFMEAVWYRKEFSLPDEWKSKRIILHFGAVDYDTEIWINGVPGGKHRGGYSSFSFDITKLLVLGTNVLTLCARDDNRSGLQPSGKQSDKYDSYACSYTRTTGIWQTVWLECVSQIYISNLKYIPDLENVCLHVEGTISEYTKGCKIEVKTSYDSKNVGYNSAIITGKTVTLTIKLSEVHIWGPSEPNLYDLEISLCKDNECLDKVGSYFGLRSVAFTDHAMLINGKPVFQRLVLDQGFYPEGVYTAPTDEDLKRDIKISMGLGFNGARLHEKIFEPRFLYWADKLGYLVWGEHANWGLDITTPMGLENFLPEWMEALERDFNHPSIVGWCPFNETWDKTNLSSDTNGWKPRSVRQDDEVLRIVYHATKMFDKTRPVIDTSGNYHVVTDIFDVHDYDQDPTSFASRYEPMKNGGEAFVNYEDRQKYEGQPYFVSEYGGIWWNPGETEKNGWGYGGENGRPKSEDEFIKRYAGLTKVLLDNPNICAFCYTQLYDVEQEVNGLYTYDRKAKFDPLIFKKINSMKAAIEE